MLKLHLHRRRAVTVFIIISCKTYCYSKRAVSYFTLKNVQMRQFLAFAYLIIFYDVSAGSKNAPYKLYGEKCKTLKKRIPAYKHFKNCSGRKYIDPPSWCRKFQALTLQSDLNGDFAPVREIWLLSTLAGIDISGLTAAHKLEHCYVGLRSTV